MTMTAIYLLFPLLSFNYESARPFSKGKSRNLSSSSSLDKTDVGKMAKEEEEEKTLFFSSA